MNNNKNLPEIMNLPRLMERFFNDPFLAPDHFSQNDLNMPAANVREDEKNYEVELSVPGWVKDDFHIDLEDGRLTISAKAQDEKTEEQDDYTYREFSNRSFSRSFALPKGRVDEAKAEAAYKNGLLKITLPKKELEAGRRLKVLEK